MKLISCYIENFGGLSRYSLDFAEGLTAITGPNGFGKSTLAEFLRAMLYGFPRKAKNLEKSRRQKYLPWGGGICGGNLIFEHEGVRYRVERTFGATPRGDSFRLIDLETGRKSSRFSEELGMELFQLDAESFERSTYMPQLHEGLDLTTNAIQAKLSDLVEDTGDINNYDRAIKTLREKRSSFIPYRGGGGTVAAAEGKISELQQELDRAMLRKKELHGCDEQIRELENSIAEKKRELDQTRQQWEQASRFQADRARYEDLKVRYEAVTSELDTLAEQYPAGIPEAEEINAAREIAEGLSAAESPQTYIQIDQAELDALIAQNRLLLRQRTELEMMVFPEEERQRLVQLNAAFPDGLPTEEEIENHFRMQRGCELLRQENQELTARAAEHQKRNILPIIAGAAAAVLGIVLLALRYFLVGGIALAAGIALAVWFLLRRKEKSAGQLRRKIEANEQRIAEMEQRILEFTEGRTLDEIQRSREEILTLGAKLRTLKEKRADCERAAERTELQLHQALSVYFGDVDDFDGAIADLRLTHGQNLDRQQKQKAADAELDAFFARFGLRREPDVRKQLQRIYDDFRCWEIGILSEGQLAAQLKRFPQIPAEMDADALMEKSQRLTGQCEAMAEELLGLRQTRRELCDQAERIPQLHDELERWQAQKQADCRKVRILDDTVDFLQQARENLTSSYLGPIRTHFGRYLARLMGEGDEKVLISSDLEVQLERLGKARELGYFSAGQTDMVMLCMRLALVDALFPKVKPFVILDDPFVNLDDERVKAALTLLKELSQDRQIIYMTCSSSRSI